MNVPAAMITLSAYPGMSQAYGTTLLSIGEAFCTALTKAVSSSSVSNIMACVMSVLSASYFGNTPNPAFSIAPEASTAPFKASLTICGARYIPW